MWRNKNETKRTRVSPVEVHKPGGDSVISADSDNKGGVDLWYSLISGCVFIWTMQEHDEWRSEDNTEEKHVAHSKVKSVNPSARAQETREVWQNELK